MSESTVSESYCRARNSDDLTLRYERRGDADYLIASGWAARLHGADLYDLLSRWSRIAKPDFAAMTDKNQYTSEMAMVFVKLGESWPRALAELRAICEPMEMSDVAAQQILWWWLDHKCDACQGRGYMQIPGTPNLSDTPCKACGGTGDVPIPRGELGKKAIQLVEEAVDRYFRRMDKALWGRASVGD